MTSFELHIESTSTTSPRAVNARRGGKQYMVRTQFAKIFIPLQAGDEPVEREFKISLWDDQKPYPTGIYTVTPNIGLKYGELAMFGHKIEPKPQQATVKPPFKVAN